eukprot:TRINITY_DN6088_c2_g1_i1.p1 TRINITY_DN6088_c2_g1~~TRINITY_DN6088_c2_g1_i1.p1  ORF type:complete len:802 (+),score=237.62 TRINITY_DN6088_c2_g1_i1:100-2505(+)
MLAATVSAAALAGRITVPDGNKLLVDGVEWFSVGAPSFRHQGRTLSAADGSLRMVSEERVGGGVRRRWAGAGGSPSMHTTVTVHDTHVVFAQQFPDGASDPTASNRDGLVTSYPSLTPMWSAPKGVLAYQGDMTGDGARTGGWGGKSGLWHINGDSSDKCRVMTAPFTLTTSSAGYTAYTPSGSVYETHAGQYCNDDHHWVYTSNSASESDCRKKCGEYNCTCYDYKTGGEKAAIGSGISGTGPVVVFDEFLNTSLVLSPFGTPMAVNQVFNGTSISYGVSGGVKSIPNGFSVSTIVSLGSGVNSAMDSWGDVLLAATGKQRYAYKRDLAMQYIGYSTDNGAYYYYQTEPGKNYEDTLIDVLAYAKEVKIPYAYVLLDSWWYFKGEGQGVKTWDARPDIFPDALAGFWGKTKWPQQLHNRMWSPDNTYAKQNGGKYNFVIDGSSVAIPDDQQFWNDLIGNKTRTGAFMYEQDWLDVEFDRSKTLGESATMGTTWMQQMNDGAKHANQTIQMCMSHVRHILAATSMPQVTNARASGDYHPGNSQWNTGTTALLAHATGIAPSKDNYWSTPTQAGTHYGKGTKEPNFRMQSAALTFTGGPVAPSDMINGSDAALVMRCCDASGRLLSPDRPAAEIDAYFTYLAFGIGVNGHLWTTHSVVSGKKFGYAMGINIADQYNLTAADLYYDPTAKFLAVESAATSAVPFGAGAALTFEKQSLPDFTLYTIAPVTGQYTLLGEPDKWVSVSSQRFSDLTDTSVKLSGAAGEVVTVRWATADGAVMEGKCVIGGSGSAKSTVSAAGVRCE